MQSKSADPLCESAFRVLRPVQAGRNAPTASAMTADVVTRMRGVERLSLWIRMQTSAGGGGVGVSSPRQGRVAVGPEPRQTGQSTPAACGHDQGFVAARLQAGTRVGREFRRPTLLLVAVDVVHRRHQAMAWASGGEVGMAMALQVERRGVEPERHALRPGAPRGRCDPRAPCGRRCRPRASPSSPPAGSAPVPRGSPDDGAGAPRSRARAHGRRASPCRRPGRRPGVLSSWPPTRALDGQGLDLDPFRLAAHRLAGERQAIAVGRLVQEAHRKVLLKGGEPAPDRRLGDAQLLRGRSEAAVTRDGEEEPEVVPIEHLGPMRFRIPRNHFYPGLPTNRNRCHSWTMPRGAPT